MSDHREVLEKAQHTLELLDEARGLVAELVRSNHAKHDRRLLLVMVAVARARDVAGYLLSEELRRGR